MPSRNSKYYGGAGDNHDREEEDYVTDLHVNMVHMLLPYMTK